MADAPKEHRAKDQGTELSCIQGPFIPAWEELPVYEQSFQG